jgi:xanthine dehydrogenase YagR molybdenum-binding subunit
MSGSAQIPDHRYEGRLKVTGSAQYAAEFKVENLAYAVMVTSTIAKGVVTGMDTGKAQRASGVLAVMTPFNTVKLPGGNQGAGKPPAGRTLSLLQDRQVNYNGQPIAVIVAESLEEARYAANLLKPTYKTSEALLDFAAGINSAHPPKAGYWDPDSKRGDVAAQNAKAEVKFNQTYSTPAQNHNAMEPHATIARWEGDKLSLYDATQYISGVKHSVAAVLGIPQDDVSVECPYTGGGFGSKGSVWSHVVLAAMASRLVKRPVTWVVDRTQMFGPVGGRPRTRQNIQFGATADGKLLAVKHDSWCHASTVEDFLEPSALQTRMLYASEACQTSHRLVAMNVGVQTFQRAPGEATGTVALECALDELAYQLKMDPIELRLKNYAETDLSENKPFSSKNLKQCYEEGAKRFGWATRSTAAGTTRDGHDLIGVGMATATYPGNRSAASAVVRIKPDGSAFVGSGTQDLGTGTYTIMAQTASNALGIDLDKIEVKLGDSALPKAPVSGGSMSAASVCPAVEEAAKQAKLKAIALAIGDIHSPLHGADQQNIEAAGGKLFLKNSPEKMESYADLLARHGNQTLEAKGDAEPGQDAKTLSAHSFGAVFAEVAVNAHTKMIKVRRVTGVYDIGTLMNQKTGLNQLTGGIVWGISTALYEEQHLDPVYGRVVNNNLAEYHVPVNADIHDIDVSVLNIPDLKFNPLGARGIGEIGITGSAAAVVNAIYHATGIRVRDLPVTPDKLLG